MKLRPKVGDVYKGYSRGDNLHTYWRFQIVAIVEKDGNRFFVALKLYVDECIPYLFDEEGYEYNEASCMDFYLCGKSGSKAGYSIVRN